MFHEFKVTRFILFVFINKIVTRINTSRNTSGVSIQKDRFLPLFSFNQQFNMFFNLWGIDD